MGSRQAGPRAQVQVVVGDVGALEILVQNVHFLIVLRVWFRLRHEDAAEQSDIFPLRVGAARSLSTVLVCTGRAFRTGAQLCVCAGWKVRVHCAALAASSGVSSRARQNESDALRACVRRRPSVVLHRL